MTAAYHRSRTINLALQGGGAHGAFTWGALDRLLEEDRLVIEGISGTSAGAMNAAMLKTGYLQGGNQGARDQLAQFWGSIRRDARRNVNPLRDWLRTVAPQAADLADRYYTPPGMMVQDTLVRNFSPYEWNPFNLNPLRDLLTEMIDFSQVCKTCLPHLFISATNVRTSKIKVFSDDDLSIEVILASACLPFLFQAVEVKGEHYWDGGYMGNPALFPLFSHCHTSDVVIVHVNPIERPDVPRTAREIMNRINEISFNSSLLRELRAIDFVQRLIEEGRIKAGEMKNIKIHSIRADEVMAELDVATKLTPEPDLIDHLRDQGRATADSFLHDHWEDIGQRSTVDLRAMFA